LRLARRKIIIAFGEETMGDRDQQASAVRTLAYCVRAYSPWFVTIERNRLDPPEADRLRLYIDGLAAKLEHLAVLLPEGTVTYSQVEAVITELHDAGFYPDKLAIKTVAEAFEEEK
jgi:hypothetical protein